MAQDPIRFDDGAAYDRGMGSWSLLAGQVFLDWLSPASGLRWLDVGCGSGAFTELLLQRCAPADMQGIDPSEAQLAFARTRPGARGATFLQGDAMALPFQDGRFDAAVMALVIFFVPGSGQRRRRDGARGSPGRHGRGIRVGHGGGRISLPPDPHRTAGHGRHAAASPSPDASREATLRDLWTGAGFEAVETREISLQRSFADFEDFWGSSTITGSVRPTLAAMPADKVEQFKARVRARLPADASGRIEYQARANAIKGRVPTSS